MKKIELSEDQLNQLIALHKDSNSWLQIQKQTGISRHIAKREYENWERRQSGGDLKEARKDVAAEAFREHINSLLKIAELLPERLVVPTIQEVTVEADQVLDDLWKTDILSQSVAVGSPLVGHRVGFLQNLRQNSLLFKSLVYHTRDKVDWENLDRWKKCWNEAVGLIRRLLEESLKMLNEFLLREESQHPSVTKNMLNNPRDSNPLKKMVEAIITQLMRRLEKNTLDLASPVTRVHEEVRGPQLIYHDSFTIVVKFSNIELAKIANRACNLVADKLSENHAKGILDPLRNRIHKMEKLRGQFEEDLDPLILRPVIIRTHCDLCPA